MERKFNIIRSSEDYNSHYKRRLCVDIDTADEIRPFLYSNLDEFLRVAEKILTLPNMYSDCYKREGIEKGVVVTAIRFFDNQNTRIYCQEMNDENGTFFIICSEIFSKKSQKNNKTNKPIIEKIANYEYSYKK